MYPCCVGPAFLSLIFWNGSELSAVTGSVTHRTRFIKHLLMNLNARINVLILRLHMMFHGKCTSGSLG